MISRLRAISVVWGKGALIGLTIYLLGLPAMVAFGYFFVGSLDAAWTASIGLFIGMILRRPIVRMSRHEQVITRSCLIIYILALALGKTFGMSPTARLNIITATTLTLFFVQFWIRSECEQAVQESLARKAQREMRRWLTSWGATGPGLRSSHSSRLVALISRGFNEDAMADYLGNIRANEYDGMGSSQLDMRTAIELVQLVRQRPMLAGCLRLSSV